MRYSQISVQRYDHFSHPKKFWTTNPRCYGSCWPPKSTSLTITQDYIRYHSIEKLLPLQYLRQQKAGKLRPIPLSYEIVLWFSMDFPHVQESSSQVGGEWEGEKYSQQINISLYFVCCCKTFIQKFLLSKLWHPFLDSIKTFLLLTISVAVTINRALMQCHLVHYGVNSHCEYS